MYLLKKAVIDEIEVDIDFEMVAEDLLMISIMNESMKNNVLSYWRLTKVVGIPPLEIGVNCNHQCLAGITFFLDSTCMVKQDKVEVVVEKGAVVVDTSVFTKANDYVDVHQEYSAYIEDGKLICSFEKSVNFKYSYKTSRLEIYVDSNDKIIGFALCNLSKKEISMIKNL